MSLREGFTAFNDSHVRLAVLRLLDSQPAYQANDSVLSQAVAAMGLASTRDQMRAHLDWLQEVRLVTLITVSGLIVATLTERGADVAAGRSVVSGVARPSPKAEG